MIYPVPYCLQTISLPTSMYEAGVISDPSPLQSPATSPTPGQLFSDEWLEREREQNPEPSEDIASPMEVSIMTEVSSPWEWGNWGLSH